MCQELTDDERLAIELRHFERLRVEEVVQFTGWTVSKVKMLCSRGLKKLSDRLPESMRPTNAY